MKIWQPLMVTALLLSPTTVMAGWGVGNGGDWLRMQFLKAQEHAAFLTLRISEGALDATGASEDVKDWIIAHKQKLAADISLSNHQWTDADQPSCAYTEHQAQAPVTLSYEACAKTTKDFSHAGMLLIHESVHHFGFAHSDDGGRDFADAVAVAIYDAWQSGHIEWQKFDLADEARTQHVAVWTGDSMFVHGGLDSSNKATNSAFIFDPKTGETEAITAEGSPALHNHQAVLYQNKLILWGGLLTKTVNGNQQQLWSNKGAVYDLATKTWSDLSHPYGPETVNVYRPDSKVQTAVLAGDSLLVFGGVLDPYDSASKEIPAAKLDLNTGKWQKIATPQTAVKKQGHAAVWTGEQMLIWGGVTVNGQYTGALHAYTPASDKWQQLASTGAPKGIDHQVAAWTGEALIVFGGYYSSRDIRGMGGVYDLKTNKWTTFTTENVLARIGHTGVWTGQELIVFAGKCRRPRLTLGGVAAFNPKTSSWRTASSQTAPSARYHHSAVWTGNKMIVFGGQPANEEVHADGGIFYP